MAAWSEEGAEGSDAAKSSLVSKRKQTCPTRHIGATSVIPKHSNVADHHHKLSFFFFLLGTFWINQGQQRLGVLRLPATDDLKSSKLNLAQ